MIKYELKNPLIEAVIKSRPNRFIMMVELNGSIIKCHCPSTGRIGNIVFENIPCLISKSQNQERKTPYTVEAISLDSIFKKDKSWIGINQTKANDYIEFFLNRNQLSRMVKKGNLERERKLGNSRIDFSIGDAFLEVKMPLITLPSKKKLKIREHGKFNSFDRMIKHYRELSKNITKKSRAIVVLCYLYDAKPFTPPPINKNNIRIKKAVENAVKKGVENWQVNLKIDRHGIYLVRYFKLKSF